MKKIIILSFGLIFGLSYEVLGDTLGDYFAHAPSPNLPLESENKIPIIQEVGGENVTRGVKKSEFYNIMGLAGLDVLNTWTYNGSGVTPESVATAGFALSNNFFGFGEVDFWNLVNSDSNAQGFYFNQKTGSGTSINIAEIFSDGSIYTEFDLVGFDKRLQLSVDNANATIGSDGGIIVDTSLITLGNTTPAHLASKQTTAPALTSCGTGSPSIIGTDTAGTVTMGTNATGCVITFNAAYTGAPHCNVTWRANMLASQSYVVSTTAITITQTSTSGNLLDYICVAPAGG